MQIESSYRETFNICTSSREVHQLVTPLTLYKYEVILCTWDFDFGSNIQGTVLILGFLRSTRDNEHLSYVSAQGNSKRVIPRDDMNSHRQDKKWTFPLDRHAGMFCGTRDLKKPCGRFHCDIHLCNSTHHQTYCITQGLTSSIQTTSFPPAHVIPRIGASLE